MKRLHSAWLWFGKLVAARIGQPAWRGRTPSLPVAPAPDVADYDLKPAVAELQSISSSLEKSFLATSAALEKLANQGEIFVTQSHKLVDSATGRAGGSEVFFKAMHIAEAPLLFLNNSHTETQRLLQRLQQDNDRITELISFQSDLQNTLAPLKYIQSLFKIESAPLGGEVQTMFGALTVEIEKLHTQVCELFTTKFLELRQIRRTVIQVSHELQAQTDSLWTSVAAEQAQIDKSLKQLQHELLDNRQRESDISSLSAEINQEIQQVVIGLQYQDIVNQKLQHTRASLAKIAAAADSAHALTFKEQACRLEAGQLQAVRQDLAGAEKSIKTGIDRIQKRLVNADSQCVSMVEFQQLTTSADGMVQVLFDVFATLRKQIATTVAGSSQAFEQLRPIGGLASDLTVIVRDLSQRIHLIGLNAQVQAAQVGQGVSLEVLSAHTSDISRETNAISKNVAEKLDRLVIDLAEDVKALEALHSEALQQQSTLTHEGAAIEQELHALRDGTLSTLVDVDTLVNSIRGESQAILQTVDYVETADRPLAELQHQLQSIARTLGPKVHPAAHKSAAFIREFSTGYTMASERQVFESVVHGQARPTNAAAEVAVELFADPTPIATVPSAAPLPPPLDQREVGLAFPEPPARLVSAPVVSAPANLGENVELF